MLKVIAWVTGIAGALMGLKYMADTSFEDVFGWVYVVAGLCLAALWWSLAIVVAAAQRYLDMNRE